MDSFARLGLAEPLAKALASFGFEKPTPVQEAAIPLLLAKRDVMMESETGTGKTFAYLAPAIQTISSMPQHGDAAPRGKPIERGVGEPGILIASPTQELAVQIGREAEKLVVAAALNLRVTVLLGGTPLEKQYAKLKDKPDIVVGTLGRLADLLSLKKLKTTALRYLILDEADRLFANETEETAIAYLKSAPASCARVLVSATLPEKLRREVRPLLRDAEEIAVEDEKVLAGSIEHWCFYCDGRKRLDFVRRLEVAVKPSRCLLFLSVASKVASAGERLASLGLPIASIHAGMDKETRRVALERFANGEIRYLLTSDLGARGLDIGGISHILSLDLPDDHIVYTHRAGRTGRAGATGVSIVLADGVELSRASRIAVRGHFIFRCKVMEEGTVLEPTSEEFFERAGAAETRRIAAKESRASGKPASRNAPPDADRPRRPAADRSGGAARSRSPAFDRDRAPSFDRRYGKSADQRGDSRSRDGEVPRARPTTPREFLPRGDSVPRLVKTDKSLPPQASAKTEESQPVDTARKYVSARPGSPARTEGPRTRPSGDDRERRGPGARAEAPMRDRSDKPRWRDSPPRSGSAPSPRASYRSEGAAARRPSSEAPRRFTGDIVPVRRPSGNDAPARRSASGSVPSSRPASGAAHSSRPANDGASIRRPASGGAPSRRPASGGAPPNRPANDGAPNRHPGSGNAPSSRPSSVGSPSSRPANGGAPSRRPAGGAPGRRPSPPREIPSTGAQRRLAYRDKKPAAKSAPKPGKDRSGGSSENR